MLKYCLTVIFVLSFAAGSVAQRLDSLRWGGSVKADGSTNFGRAGDASLAVRLNCESQKWSLSAGLSGSRTQRMVRREVSYSSGKMKYGHKESALSESRGFGEQAEVSFRYTPRTQDVFRISLRQSYTGTERQDSTFAQKIGVQSGEAVLIGEGHNREKAEREQRQYRCEARYEHAFNMNRSLRADFCFQRDFNRHTTVRMLDGSLYTPKTYRITPDYERRVSDFRILYHDIRFMDVPKLDFTAGTDFSWGMNSDRYGGATLVDAQWRDSLLLKQQYLYRSALAEPYAKASYKWHSLAFAAEERLQFYHHQLWSNLNGWDWSRSDLSLISRAEVQWRPAAKHLLKLEFSRNIARPDYLQLSGLLRFGNSEGVYYLGNADLKPTKTLRTDLTYNFKIGAWEYILQGGASRMRNAAEQVLYTGEGQLPATLRDSLKNAVVYSWLNTVSKNNFHMTLRVKWGHGGLGAEAWSVLNYDVSRYGTSGSSSDDFHYTLGCSAFYKFAKFWQLSLRNSYDSRRKEVYSHTSAYLSGTLRLSRQSGSWNCYAEVREVFDKTIQRTTFSENFDYRRTEDTRNYRRLLAMGLQYNF